MHRLVKGITAILAKKIGFDIKCEKRYYKGNIEFLWVQQGEKISNSEYVLCTKNRDSDMYFSDKYSDYVINADQYIELPDVYTMDNWLRSKGYDIDVYLVKLYHNNTLKENKGDREYLFNVHKDGLLFISSNHYDVFYSYEDCLSIAIHRTLFRMMKK